MLQGICDAVLVKFTCPHLLLQAAPRGPCETGSCCPGLGPRCPVRPRAALPLALPFPPAPQPLLRPFGPSGRPSGRLSIHPAIWPSVWPCVPPSHRPAPSLPSPWGSKESLGCLQGGGSAQKIKASPLTGALRVILSSNLLPSFRSSASEGCAVR